MLYFLRGEERAGLPGFVTELERDGWQVDCVPVSEAARLRGIPDVLFSRHDLARYEVVAASEYFLTWALCLRTMFMRHAPKVVALSFNQSSRRLILTGLRPFDWLLNRVWRQLAMLLVHSRAEATMFAKLHDIPKDWFIFSHWGYDLPAYRMEKIWTDDEPYVTMIGRNNRDLATFCEAVGEAGVKGVLITAAYMVERHPITPPDGVKILVDRPMDECQNYVAGSFAHLVLVTDAERGAGHISAVSAMLLGKPQIFSDVPPLADYLIDGTNGIAVPLHNVGAVAGAIKALRDDPQLAERLGSAGRKFARTMMSNVASSRRMAEAIIAVSSGGVPAAP